MFTRTLNWFRRCRGQHVCDEFTQWVTYKKNRSRPAMFSDGPAAVLEGKITVTRRWQERQCTMCGKLYQRELKY